MNRKLPHLVFALALSGFAALGLASDSDFITDEIRGLHSELADTRRWVDSDIRANLAHRWETIPNRLAQRGFGWAESGLESLSWIPNADLAVESDSAGRLAGFSAGGTGLLWTGESAAVGFQPWGRWTDGGENDAASFGVFSRRALGDWAVVGGNVFADYAASAEFGDFARWSAGLDFQSPLGELRGNYYAGLSSTRERVGLENRVLAYAPSGVDAELRLRWFGDSEWSGFAEYEKWSGQFGDSDLEEVGYGLSFRPAGGGLLAGLRVDAGFRDSADSAGHWDLRLGYSRRLGADNSVRNLGSAFAVRSALVSPVARAREIRVESVTVQEKWVSGQARFLPYRPFPQIRDRRWFIKTIYARCSPVEFLDPDSTLGDLGARIFETAEHESRFDDLCEALQMGGDANYRGTMNATPLHQAVNGNATDNLRLLIATRADINAQNVNGMTPLDRVQLKLDRTNSWSVSVVLSTMAMLLRSSGGKCNKEDGDFCDIDISSLYSNGETVSYRIYSQVTIDMDHEGEIYRFFHPVYENVSLTYNSHRAHQKLTVTEDGRLRFKEGNIFRFHGKFSMRVAVLHSESGELVSHNLYVIINEKAHPEPVVFSPLLKAAHGYSGPLFTAEVVPTHFSRLFTFEADSRAALVYTSDNSAIVYRHAEHLFRAPLGAFTITSRSQLFRGQRAENGMSIFLHRPADVNQPSVGQVHAYVNSYRYGEILVTHNFTVSVVGYVRPLDITVTANHFGRLTILALDGIGNANYRVIAKDGKLDLDGRGALNLKPGLELAETISLVAEITSPDLLGTVFVTAYVVAGCPKPAGYSLIRDGPGNGDYEQEGNKLIRAAKGNIGETCRLLQLGADPNFKSGGGQYTPIYRAAEKGQHHIVNMLLDFGANVNLTYGSQKISALHVAAWRGYHLIGEALLERGILVGLKNRYRQTALHLVAKDHSDSNSDPLALARILINRGAVIDEGDNTNKTPLYHAVDRNIPGLPELLISRGANPNVVETVRTFTPLHIVERLDHAMALVNAGANVNKGITKRNLNGIPYGMTPLDWIDEPEILRYLRGRGAQCRRPEAWSDTLEKCVY